MSSSILIDKTEHPVDFSFRNYERRPVKKDATTGVPTAPVDMNGWDTVFAIKIADVNRAITKREHQSESPIPTEYSQSLGFPGQTLTGSGELSNWRVVPGGDGTTVRMAVDMPSGSVVSTAGGNSTTFPYVDLVLTFLVNLAFIPRAGTATGPLPTDLQMATPVSGVQVDYDRANPPNSIVIDTVPQLMQIWLDANLSAFQIIFATVNLNSVAAQDNWQWLMPTATAYAYKQRGLYAQEDDCFLGVLCTTSSRNPSNLEAALDTAAVPDGAESGFVIGSTVYLQHIVLPNIAQAFDNAAGSDFEMAPNADGTYTLVNTNEITMTCDGKKFTVQSHNFTVTIGAGNLVASFVDAKHEVSAGIQLYLNYTAKTKCSLTTRSDGSQAFLLEDDGDIETTHRVEKEPWVTITEVVAGAIVSAVLAGVGEMAGGNVVNKLVAKGLTASAESITGRLVKIVIAGLISIFAFGLIINIGTLVQATADRDADKLPPFNPFLQDALKNVEWAGWREAEAQSVTFNNGLIIGLNPKFVD